MEEPSRVSPPAASYLGQALPSLISAVLAILLYAVSIPGTYVYDDFRVIVEDSRVHDLSQWGRFWTESYNGSADNPFRPLTSISYAAEWWLHGDRPWIFHLINVLLHGAVSGILAEFVRRLLISPRAAVLCGILFASHPVHVEAVANIAGRPELLCALGIFGALTLFMKPVTPLRAMAIAGCFAVALLSKEQGMLLPLLMIALVFVRKRSGRFSSDHRLSVQVLLASLFAVVAAYAFWRESFLPLRWDHAMMDWTTNPMIPGPTNPHGGSIGADRLLMPLVILGRYAALLVAPLHLSPDYGGTVIGWTADLRDPYLYLGIVTLLLWLILLVTSRNPVVRFALIALAIIYGMIGNVIGFIGTNFADRLMYLPSAFFLLLLAMVFINLKAKWSSVLLTILLAFYSIRTITYAHRWNDRLNFYETALAEQPRSIKLMILVAHENSTRRNFAKAEQVISNARQTMPEYAQVWVRSGAIAMDQNKWDESGQYFQHAMTMHPDKDTVGWITELARRRSAASATSHPSL